MRSLSGIFLLPFSCQIRLNVLPTCTSAFQREWECLGKGVFGQRNYGQGNGHFVFLPSMSQISPS
jgi:hypothetical protein